MKQYSNLLRQRDVVEIQNGIDQITNHFTIAQFSIRKDFLEFTKNLYIENSTEENWGLVEESISLATEYYERRPSDPLFSSKLVNFYNDKDIFLKDPRYLVEGEKILRELLLLSPNRPDINRSLAANLFFQDKYDESFIYFEKSFDLYSEFFALNLPSNEHFYNVFIKYFYESRGKENFIKTVDRLMSNNYKDSNVLVEVVEYLNKTGMWPKIGFE